MAGPTRKAIRNGYKLPAEPAGLGDEVSLCGMSASPSLLLWVHAWVRPQRRGPLRPRLLFQLAGWRGVAQARSSPNSP